MEASEIEVRAEVKRERGCGYRKVGGIYLVSGGMTAPCGLLPRILETCPCCGVGVHQKIGWTWAQARLISREDDVLGCHYCEGQPPTSCPMRVLAVAPETRVGLIWIGEQHYKTPAAFLAEGNRMGISRRIHAFPKGFVAGETQVLLAHPKGTVCGTCSGSGIFNHEAADGRNDPNCPDCNQTGHRPAIFSVWNPERVEQIITETQAQDEAFVESLKKRNIWPVIVPDDDPDYQPRRRDNGKAGGEHLDLEE